VDIIIGNQGFLSQVENRELEMTSTSTIPNNGSVHNPISVNLHQELHSTLNKSYTNTYSSCGSFTLPSIIGKGNKPQGRKVKWVSEKINGLLVKASDDF